MPSSDIVTSPTTDPFQKLYHELQAQRDTLKRRWAQMAPTTQELANVIEGTVLSFMMDVTMKVAQLRDGTTGALGELADRIDQMQQDSVLLPDDAEKLLAFIDGVGLLFEYLDAAAVPPDVKERLGSLRALGVECRAIVEDAAVEGDDDEDEDETDGDDETDIVGPS